MKKNVYRGTFRPLGFLALLFFAIWLFFFLCLIFLLFKCTKNFSFSFESIFSCLLKGLFVLLVTFIFLFPLLGQKIVVKENKMHVYLWGKRKWSFDLALPHKAEFGFYYQGKFDRLFHPSRKYPSIQVKGQDKNACFPVDLYSTKQVRTLVFILNNSADEKFTDPRLRGQEKYLIHQSLVRALVPKENSGLALCEFCMEKFGLKAGMEKGYASKNRRYWICEKCFEDFNEMFKFRVIKNTKADRIKE